MLNKATARRVIVGLLLTLLASLFLKTSLVRATPGSTSPDRTLKSASELDYPPFALVRPDGSTDGFSVELLKAVTQAIGMQVEIPVGPWHEIKQELAEGRLDVLPLVSYSADREKVYDFTVPYIQMHGTVFVRKGESSIHGEADLKGKEVLVMRGDTAHEYAVGKNLSDKLILTESYAEAFTLLSEGKHDAIVCQYLVGLQLIKKLALTNIVSISSGQEMSLRPSGRPTSGFEQKFCFAVKKDDHELLGHLNEGLAIVFADGTYARLYDKWFGPILPPKPVAPIQIVKYLLFTLLPILGLLAIGVAWYLRREVARKTASLQEEIAAHKKVEAALVESEQKYFNFLDNLNSGVVVHAADSSVLYCNRKASQLLHLSYDQMIGKKSLDPLWKFLNEDGSDMINDDFPISTVIRTNNDLKDHVVGIVSSANESVTWLSCSSLTIHNQNGELDHVVISFYDITKQKETETERVKLEEQLRQSHKMEAVGTMAGGIAHDFNNILAIIIGNTELAMDDLPPGNPAKDCLEEMLKASNRAKDLIRQILAFSRKEKKELIPIQLQSLVKETLTLLRATTPSTISIVQDIAQDCSTIMADPTQLHQLTTNLFINAVHAMDEKGEVSVSLQQVELTPGDLDQFTLVVPPATKAAGRYVRLSVTDLGVGIQKKAITRIFDPFYTTKGVGQGTGMGLAVVHGIVESHNGFIAVASEVGKGSTFNVFFPITEEANANTLQDTATPQTGTETILVVDDEEGILEMCSRMLQRLGYTVVPQNSSVEALQLFKSNPDKFDLVMTDQSMPNMSGSDLIAEMLKIRADIPVILCTGFSTKVSEKNARGKGVSKFLNKPYDKTSLAKAIREVLDRQQ